MIKMMTALLSLVLLAPFIVLPAMTQTAGQQQPAAQQPQATGQPSQPPQQQPTEPSQQQPAPRKQPQWKSREEYDAFNSVAAERDPKKRISLAEAFIQKFSNSDFKGTAYVAIMQSYQQLSDSAKAIEAAKKAVDVDPDNLMALAYLSFAFPFVFKETEPNPAGELATAETDAKRGLDLLQKLQKPPNVTDEVFNQQVKAWRATFNGAIGFVALQRKDYPAAIASFKAATEDNPSDFYSFYRMGLAYLFSTPRDYDHAVWYMARAVSLAKSANDPNAEAFQNYLRKTYVGYHGNDRGISDIITQAASSPNPPEGFKVAAMETPKETGNPNIDAFNKMTFPLRLGGEKAEEQWKGLKGQEIQLGGFVESVEKGTDSASYLVRIAVLQQSKAAGGYDVGLKDTTQPNVKNLSKGDPVTFKGILTAYTATPNLTLSVDGQITTPLPEAAEKPKPKRKPSTTRKRAARTQN